MMRAAMSMQGADVAPTARQIAACDAARAPAEEAMRRWRDLSTKGLEALNAGRTAAGLRPIPLR